MKDTVRLGRVAGVRVGLHWSVVGILLLLALNVTRFPDRSVPAYLLAAVAAGVLFVASLLAHELAHAVIARRRGIEVDGITLWLLGGVARLRGEARTPGAEFAIAAVGPAASLLAGLVLGAAAWLTRAAGADGLVSGVLSYLAAINVVLAVFNVVPAAPLDGGRILRAALWAWCGDRTRATVWSARAGRGFGFALMLLGAVTWLTGSFGGLWWVLVGLFLVTVAAAEERHARLGTALAGVRVRDVMSPDPETAMGQLSVADFLRGTTMARRRAAYPLMDSHGRFDGLVTLNRLRGVPVARRATTTLREVACPPEDVPVVRSDDPLTALLPRLGGRTGGRALVFDHDSLVGIVTPRDIASLRPSADRPRW